MPRILALLYRARSYQGTRFACPGETVLSGGVLENGHTLEEFGQWCRRHTWIGHLAVLGTSAFFLATGTGWLLTIPLLSEESQDSPAPVREYLSRNSTPRSAARPATSTGDLICRRNVFDFENRPCVAAPTPVGRDEASQHSAAAPELCKGKAFLVGTVTSPVRERCLAMIETQGKTKTYRVGDEVPELGEVEQVGWRLVLVDRPQKRDCLLDVFVERPRPKKRTRPRRRPNSGKRRNRRSKRRSKRRGR